MSAILSRPLAARVQDISDHAPFTTAGEPSAALTDGALTALDEGKTKYTDRPGIIGLRQWVTTQLNSRYAIGLSPDEVTITCGIQEARFVSLVYLGYGGQVSSMQPDSAPQNVRVVSQWAENAAPLIETVVVEDQHLIWEVINGWADIHPAQDPNLRPRTVTIGEFDGLGDGWRVGWMAGHAEHAKLRAYKQSMTICTPSVSQWATLAMLEAQS